jgi:hypothetical protein
MRGVRHLCRRWRQPCFLAIRLKVQRTCAFGVWQVKIRGLIAIANVLIASNAAGCASPGVTFVAPVGGSSAANGVSTTPSSEAGTGAVAVESPGPCPAGYSCVGSMGYTVTDAKGNKIANSCGMGTSTVTCDDANPVASCPHFSKPLCGHIAGMSLCQQLCTP